MLIKSLVVGPLEVNCFLVGDEKTREIMIIDPGDEPDRILDVVKENNLKVKYIVCTHAHFDHVGAVTDIKNETGAKVIIHIDELEIYNNAKDLAAFWGYKLDPLPNPDMFVKEGDQLELGHLKFEVFHTPGHSPGEICLYSEGVVLTGDTVFAGSVGRTDLPGGNLQELKKSFSRIISLPPETQILPGHGEWSTVKAEKEMNFFIQDLQDR